MRDGELLRARFAFGLLGAVPVFLAGWLAWVQVAQAGELARDGKAPLRLVPETADGQARRREHVPAPRGTILDRNGAVLALDCETYEVRADVRVPEGLRKDVAKFRGFLGSVIDDLSLALADDPELADRAAARAHHAERLAKMFAREFKTAQLPASGPVPEGHPGRADVLLAADIDTLSVIEALRHLGTAKRFATVTLHFLRSFDRDYPERELTYGIVGHIDSKWRKDAAGRAELHTFGVCGLEARPELAPDDGTARDYLKDGKGQPYFLAPLTDAPVPSVVHSTLDIDLQRIAIRELSAQAEAGAREGAVRIPKWGALVLVEIATGDVLAAASWHRDAKHPQAAQFTPTQALFEPGSIVKPLVLSYAYEAGVLDWNHVFDCSPGGNDYRERIAGLGRKKPVRDDHPCHDLTPHGIIVNSSNIGASFCGLLLDRAQWRDYMQYYGIGTPLPLGLPFMSVGGTNKQSFAESTPLRSFRANSAISFSFGYEHQVTAMHIARAYLRLFRGAKADLRLCAGLEVEGKLHAQPAVLDAGPHFRPEVLEAVRAAMVDVVSDDPHATGSHVHRQMLKELGIDVHGLVAGKTGTAASNVPVPDRGTISVRNASFVGFLPVESPRYLAVCVLQKDDSAKFMGGSYAAPPAVRLLLQCQQLEQQRLQRQDSQSGSSGQAREVLSTPGDSGWSRGAPETTSVGR